MMIVDTWRDFAKAMIAVNHLVDWGAAIVVEVFRSSNMCALADAPILDPHNHCA